MLCAPWNLAFHIPGESYNILDSRLSLSFNSEDGGVYCLIKCFTKVNIKLCIELTLRSIYNIEHPLLKRRVFPEMENLFL